MKDDGLTRSQKIVQIVLAWLVPVLGPVTVLGFQGRNHTRQEMKELVPPPFHMVGFGKVRQESYREDGEGVCG